MSPAPPPDRSWITPVVPSPDYAALGVRCPVMVLPGDSHITWRKCGKWFLFDKSYRQHWEQAHRPHKPRPTPQPPMSVEEEGRRLASRRDDLITLGVPPNLLAVPHAPRHRHPFNVKNSLVMDHGEQWAPLVINVDGITYVRADLREDT